MIFITTELLEQAADWIQLELGFRPHLTRVADGSELGVDIDETGLTRSQLLDVANKLIEFLGRIFEVTKHADVPPVP